MAFNSRDKRGLVIGLVCFGVLSATGVGSAFIVSQQGTRDEAGCSSEGGLEDVIVALIDESEGLEDDFVASIVGRLVDLASDTPVGGRFTVASFGKRESPGLRTIFSSCNPGRGDNRIGLTHNGKRERKQYRSKFERPLRDSLEALRGVAAADSTRLLEAIFDLAKSRVFRPDAPTRRLVIVSDMLHHTGEFSLLDARARSDGEAARYLASLDTELSRVEITVLFVQRPRYARQQVGLEEFWRERLERAGATVEWQAISESDSYSLANLGPGGSH